MKMTKKRRGFSLRSELIGSFGLVKRCDYIHTHTHTFQLTGTAPYFIHTGHTQTDHGNGSSMKLNSVYAVKLKTLTFY